MLSEKELDDRIITIRIHTADSDNAAIIALVRANTPMPQWAAARIEELEDKLRQAHIALGDSEIKRKRLQTFCDNWMDNSNIAHKSLATAQESNRALQKELSDVKAELSAFQSECDSCQIGFAKDEKSEHCEHRVHCRTAILLNQNLEVAEAKLAELKATQVPVPEGWEEDRRAWLLTAVDEHRLACPEIYAESIPTTFTTATEIGSVTFYRRIELESDEDKIKAALRDAIQT
jgi:chromosome segregation ATPase